MNMIARAALALAMPLLLWGCVLTPGKFVSSLTINADRTFVFAYKGEVIAIDPSSALKGIGESKPGEGKETKADPAVARLPADVDPETKNRAIADALKKEAGYRSVVYRGNGKFDIDYVMSGSLTHAFLFPFNADAQAIIPFVMVEVRQAGTVRVRAPGFASNQSGTMTGMGGGGSDGPKFLDGIFTLDTDAEIVSQNNEDGAKTAGPRKQITWRVTPATWEEPSAVLRLNKL